MFIYAKLSGLISMDDCYVFTNSIVIQCVSLNMWDCYQSIAKLAYLKNTSVLAVKHNAQSLFKMK